MVIFSSSCERAGFLAHLFHEPLGAYGPGIISDFGFLIAYIWRCWNNIGAQKIFNEYLED